MTTSLRNTSTHHRSLLCRTFFGAWLGLGLAANSVLCCFAQDASVTVNAGDVAAATKRIAALGSGAKLTMAGEKLTEIAIQDGSVLTEEDIALFGRLGDLQKLQILNCRALNTAMAAKLHGLKQLKSLALTNTVIDDAAVEGIVKAFPGLIELDLSSNANMSSSILKPISELKQLQTLTLIQNRLNELSTRRLSKLLELRALDLRGNMEAGNMTLETLASLPKLKAIKHRSSAITDFGMEQLSRNQSIENMLIQDFAITSASGEHIAKLKKLSQLEIFRCQGFGNEGVLALKGMALTRLTLRDLPILDDSAMEVLKSLPALKRLYIHEISSITDSGLANLASATTLELLDIWSVPQMGDATVDVIAKLPNLKELSIRTTAISDKSIERILAMPKLQSLTLKENNSLTAAGLKKLSAKKWTKLDLGSSE